MTLPTIDLEYVRKLEDHNLYLEEKLEQTEYRYDNLYDCFEKLNQHESHPDFVKEVTNMLDPLEPTKFPLLSYYPFGKETTYYYMSSHVDLQNMESEPWFSKIYEGKSMWRLVAEIFKELNRAIFYLSIHESTKNGFLNQRRYAFAESALINSGIYYWKTDLSEEQKDIIAKERYENNKMTYASTLKEERDKIDVYGVYTCVHPPLISEKNGVTIINYNENELRAIHFMIAQCEFENLC